MTTVRLSLALLCLGLLTFASANRNSIDSDSLVSSDSHAVASSGSDPIVNEPSSDGDDDDNSENGGAGAISRGQHKGNIQEKEIDETQPNSDHPDSAQAEQNLRSVLQSTFDHISTLNAVADSPVRDPKQQQTQPQAPSDHQSLAPAPQVIAATPGTLNTLRAAAKTLKQRLHVMDGLRKRVLRLYSQYASASLDPSAIERLDQHAEGAASTAPEGSPAPQPSSAQAEVNEADMSAASAIFGGAAIPIVGEADSHADSNNHKASLVEVESSEAEYRPSDMMKGPLFVGVPARSLREREQQAHHVTHPPLTKDQMAARALRLKQRLEQMHKRSKVAPPTKAMGHYSNCYNANLLLGKDQRSLCNAISSDLAEPYEDSAAFNEACTGLLGSFCAGECRMLANMFDSPTYNHDSEETTSTYPLATNNKVLGYTISRDDCRRCLVYGQCYNTISVPTNPDAFYSAP